MAEHGCPSRELLMAYQMGKLPDDKSAEKIAAHLGRCSRCRELLKTIGQEEDSLVARLRRPEGKLHTDEPPCRELLQGAGGSQTPGEASSAVLLTCSCGRQFRLGPQFRGKRVRCNLCGASLTVPEVSPEPMIALPPGMATAKTQTAAPDDAAPIGGKTNSASTGNHGPYVLVRPLDAGGMGRVSLARDEALKRDVAIKELLNPASANDVTWRRFVEEAEITGQLEHPGVVPVYAMGTDRDGMPFYAMRLVRGNTLKNAIAELHSTYSSAGLRELLRRFVAVCQTVAYAHHRGIVHRDIKPSNIMLGEYGETLVMDWGLARPAPPDSDDSTVGDMVEQHADRPKLTLSGGPVGTPAYMSPEQASGDSRPVTPQADVYSLGAVLYEILCGQPPFSGESADEILEQVRFSSPQNPSAVEPRTPRPLDAVCLKAMGRASWQRYASPLALADDVQRWLDDEPVSVYQEPILERVYRWTRKHKTLATSIAVFAVILAVVIVISNVMVVREQKRTLSARQLAEDYAKQAAEAEKKAQEKESKAKVLAEEVRKARQEASLAIQKAALSEIAVVQAKETIGRLENDLKSKTEETQKIRQQITQAQAQQTEAEITLKQEKQRAAAAEDRARLLEKDVDDLRTEARELRALAAQLVGLAKGAPAKPAAKQPEAARSPSEDFTEQPAESFDVTAADKTPCVLTVDTANVSVGRQSLQLDTLGASDICVTYPRSRNADWDLSTKRTLRVALLLDDPSAAFGPEGITIRLGRGSNYLQCQARADVVKSTSGQWTRLIVPLGGNATWTRSDVNKLDLSHVDWIEIHFAAEKPGMKLWLDALSFEPPRAVAPFDAARAKEYQESWSQYLGVPREITNSIGMTFVLIPPGEFMMGTTPEEMASTLDQWKRDGLEEYMTIRIAMEGPRHRVRITRPFYLSKCEVTQGQVFSVLNKRLARDGLPDDVAADLVSYDEAVAFCAKAPAAFAGDGSFTCRLPTEAEWEYACRAGTQTPYYFGQDEKLLDDNAWWRNNYADATHPVGLKKPNAWNLHDMLGNVKEWCADWLKTDYYAESPVDDPPGPASSNNGGQRVLRSGYYEFATPSVLRSATRNYFFPSAQPPVEDFRFRHGFRVACDISTLHSPPPAAAVAPFDEKKAKEYQAAWAKYLGVPVEMTNSIGMTFVLIPPGEFMMGSTPEEIVSLERLALPPNDPDLDANRLSFEQPVHRVRLSEPFYLGANEVTQADYQRIMGRNPSLSRGSGESCPVENVSWSEARDFCSRLSGLAQEKQAKRTYRLPTEAEWEYSYRAGTTTTFFFADKETRLGEYAWWAGNTTSGATHPVGLKRPNAWGAYDMIGNVFEYCQDCFDKEYYKNSPDTNPCCTKQGSLFVLRGGCWNSNVGSLRSAWRGYVSDPDRNDRNGFRAVCSVSRVDPLVTLPGSDPPGG
ncbi:MAG: SUMF1/EgtB/PvdO family nonheme iron enzyme [Pirellulales bacterium]|nr:SUMF1/EgtB/PvdO family nonheme iron enzyme [Pirellulales bacterium]